MKQQTTLHFFGKACQLLPERALFLEDSRTLVLADLHLGKAAHFRKAGIVFPIQNEASSDYKRLRDLIEVYRPDRIVFLGDLFHSQINSEWRHFEQFMHNYRTLEIILIKGNHDIIPEAVYNGSGLRIIPEIMKEKPFIFSHAPLQEVEPGWLNVSGHIHPGCVIRGKARQRLKLPCFHYEYPHFILPAFGSLTGLYTLQAGQDIKQFAIAGGQVIPAQNQ